MVLVACREANSGRAATSVVSTMLFAVGVVSASSAANTPLPPVIHRYQLLHPGIKLSFRIGNTELTVANDLPLDLHIFFAICVCSRIRLARRRGVSCLVARRRAYYERRNWRLGRCRIFRFTALGVSRIRRRAVGEGSRDDNTFFGDIGRGRHRFCEVLLRNTMQLGR